MMVTLKPAFSLMLQEYLSDLQEEKRKEEDQDQQLTPVSQAQFYKEGEASEVA